MEFTKHAQIRSNQRAIPKEAIDVILNDGNSQKVLGPAIEYHLNKRAIDLKIHQLKSEIKLMEKLKKAKVVVSNDDNIVITVYYKKWCALKCFGLK